VAYNSLPPLLFISGIGRASVTGTGISKMLECSTAQLISASQTANCLISDCMYTYTPALLKNAIIDSVIGVL
jgi:hypothetical protein